MTAPARVVVGFSMAAALAFFPALFALMVIVLLIAKVARHRPGRALRGHPAHLPPPMPRRYR